MTTVDEILNTPKIKEFLETHLGAVDAVTRAANLLVAEPDAVVAVEKLLAALSTNTISVFFSYKKKDEAAAKAVVETLREGSAGKLAITYQAEFTEESAGRNWREAICRAIRPANWFVLLLPDPSDDWDWCLFETGLFDAQRCSADRLICLHHPDTEIPPQIESYQAVAATFEEVEKLLRMVFVLNDPVPGMKALNSALEKKFPIIAKEIVEAVRPPRRALTREFFEPWVELRIDHPETLAGEENLDAARISNANKRALDLFGFNMTPPTWKELRSEVRESDGDSRWRQELVEALQRIAQGKKFLPVQAVFQASDGRIYRPVACAIDRIGERGPIDTFHVAFSEDLAAVDRSFMPKDLAILGDTLRFVFRFRWEVLEPFSRPPITMDDLERLRNRMSGIKKDWESRHVGSTEEIFAVFSEEHRERFAEMSLHWQKISNDDGTGELDLAIENGEPEKVAPLLARFLPMNQEFLQIAAERFTELVAGVEEPLRRTA